MRGLIRKYGPRCFSCNLEEHFISDIIQFWHTLAEAKHPRHEEAFSVVKVSRARLMNEAESRKKEVTQGTFATTKVKTLPDDAIASNVEASPASALELDYGLAARTALQKVQQELATKEVEHWVRSELEKTELREKLDTLDQEPKERGLKLNVISGKTFGMTREGSKIMSII